MKKKEEGIIPLILEMFLRKRNIPVALTISRENVNNRCYVMAYKPVFVYLCLGFL